MLRSLFRNVAISGVAFFLISGIGLLLVPLLLSKYGLAGFGQIALARLFLPVAALAVLDFGFGEIATQSVAKAHTDGDWESCGRMLTLVVGLVAVVGIATCGALIAAAPWIPGWMSVPTSSQVGLTRVLLVTGVALPLLFLSLVSEGIIKGFENFVAQRSIEVMSAMSYAAMACCAVWQDWHVDAVCYALIVSLVLRASVATAIATRGLRRHRVRFGAAAPAERFEFKTKSLALATNKVLGASQSQLPPALIGLLFGPTALGTFDALNRLPRFAKGVFGFLSSAVLPIAARLDSAADSKELRRLGQTGVLLIALVSLPPLAAAAALSEPILRFWLGQDFAPLWAWHTALFVIPAVSGLLSFGGTALLVKSAAISAMNRLVIVQIIMQVVISLAASIWLREMGFVLGHVIAVALTFAFQMRLIGKQLGVPPSANWQLARLGAVMLVLALPCVALASEINQWWWLLVATATWPVACWVACVFLVLTPSQRCKLAAAINQFTASSKRQDRA